MWAVFLWLNASECVAQVKGDWFALEWLGLCLPSWSIFGKIAEAKIVDVGNREALIANAEIERKSKHHWLTFHIVVLVEFTLLAFERDEGTKFGVERPFAAKLNLVAGVWQLNIVKPFVSTVFLLYLCSYILLHTTIWTINWPSRSRAMRVAFTSRPPTARATAGCRRRQWDVWAARRP